MKDKKIIDDAEYKKSMMKKFDVLISLILDLSENKKLSIAEKVKRLMDCNLKSAEIAEILNKKSNYISVVMKRMKRK